MLMGFVILGNGADLLHSGQTDLNLPFRLFILLSQTFAPLVDKHGLKDEDQPVPVEFIGDHER